MNCPQCRSPLTRIGSGSLVLDQCSGCHGIFFDSGELQPYFEALIANDDIPADPFQFGKARAVTRAAEDSLSCPKCAGQMSTINYGYDSNVILDRCGHCEGIWVEAHEVQPLAGYIKGNPHTDRLTGALLEHTQSMQRAQENLEAIRSITSARVMPLGLYLGLIPLGDDNERRVFPWLTLSFIAACVVIGIAEVIAFANGLNLIAMYGFRPGTFLQFENVATVVTHMFLHASILHLAGNMLFLWIFGDNVEEEFGHMAFAVFYLVGGVSAVMLHTAMYPTSDTPCVGASGAIAGVMGAYFVFHPQARIKTLIFARIFDIPAFFYLAVWFAFQTLGGLLDFALEANASIAYFAHIGGFVFGAATAFIFTRMRSLIRS